MSMKIWEFIKGLGVELDLIGSNCLGNLVGRLPSDSTVIGRFPVPIQSRIEIEIGPSPD